MKLSVNSVFSTVTLVFNGIVFWFSMMTLFILLSCMSFDFAWLLWFTLDAAILGMVSYNLGEEDIKAVTGINWIEKKFHIDITEE